MTNLEYSIQLLFSKYCFYLNTKNFQIRIAISGKISYNNHIKKEFPFKILFLTPYIIIYTPLENGSRKWFIFTFYF